MASCWNRWRFYTKINFSLSPSIKVFSFLSFVTNDGRVLLKIEMAKAFWVILFLLCLFNIIIHILSKKIAINFFWLRLLKVELFVFNPHKNIIEKPLLDRNEKLRKKGLYYFSPQENEKDHQHQVLFNDENQELVLPKVLIIIILI